MLKFVRNHPQYSSLPNNTRKERKKRNDRYKTLLDKAENILKGSLG